VLWYRGFREAILSLEEHPDRCPVTPENANLRHPFYGYKPYFYRVLYRVKRRKPVDVLHIRHGAPAFLSVATGNLVAAWLKLDEGYPGPMRIVGNNRKWRTHAPILGFRKWSNDPK